MSECCYLFCVCVMQDANTLKSCYGQRRQWRQLHKLCSLWPVTRFFSTLMERDPYCCAQPLLECLTVQVYSLTLHHGSYCRLSVFTPGTAYTQSNTGRRLGEINCFPFFSIFVRRFCTSSLTALKYVKYVNNDVWLECLRLSNVGCSACKEPSLMSC